MMIAPRLPATGGHAAGTRDRGYITGFDSIRGVAALLVAVFHFHGFLLPDLELGPFGPLVAKGYLAVDLFFILSGFVLCHVYADAFERGVDRAGLVPFVVARFARTYPLHAVTLAVLVAMELVKLMLVLRAGADIGQAPFEGNKSLSSLLANIFMLQSLPVHEYPTWNGPAWSISAEWAAYLLFPLLAAPFLRCRRAVLIAVACVCIAGLYAITIGRDHRELDLSVGLGIVRCLFGFAIGMVLNRLARDGLPGFLARDGTFLAALVLSVAPMYLGLHDIWIIPGFAMLVLAAAANHGKAARAMAWSPLVVLGTVSYSVYLGHGIVQRVAETGWKTVTGAPFGTGFSQSQSALALLFLIAASVMLAVLLFHAVERPARRLIRSALESPRRRARPQAESQTRSQAKSQADTRRLFNSGS